MKKLIGIFIVVILSILILQFIAHSLDRCRNILLVQADIAINIKELELLLDYVRKDSNILDISIYTRGNSEISVQGKSLNDFFIYEVDGLYSVFQNVELIKGRFIWDRDITNKRKYVVLEKEIAIEFFSTVDCIGKKVDINGEEYSVTGVYKKNSAFSSLISSIDRNRVYIPHSLAGIQNTYVLMIRLKDGLSSIMEDKLEKDLKRMIGSDIIVENIDLKARRIIQYIKITYLLLMLVFALNVFKVWLPLARNVWREFENELSNSYMITAVKKHYIQIVIYLAPILILLLIIYLNVKSIRVDTLIDADIVPYRLIDLKQIKNNLMNCFIDNNTARPVVSYFHSLIMHLTSLAFAGCFFLIGIFCTFIKELYEKVLKIMPDQVAVTSRQPTVSSKQNYTSDQTYKHNQ